MKETGELLKKRRIEKNYSLEEISSQTKIQLSILRTLEDGRLEDLKNKTYTKGFLRQYARALQLNPEEIVAMFDKETGASAPPVEVKMKVEEPIQEKTNVLWFRAPSKMITFAGILLIGTLAAAIYFLTVKMASYSEETFKEPTAEEQTVAAPAEENETAKTEAPTAEVKPEDTPKAEAAAAAVAVAPAPATPTPAAPEAATKPAPDKTATPAPTDKPAAGTTAAEPAPAPAPAKPKSVILVAQDDITIEATWSSGKTEKITLKNQSKHTFLYPKKITLTISNGGKVKVTSNGEELGAPGEAGQPVTLSFD